MNRILEGHNDRLAEICRRYRVAELEVFGSAATDEFDEERSDLDFLVVFDNSVGRERFDSFFDLQEELKRLFGREVDLVEPEGLRNPYFIQGVNRTRRKLYAAP